MHKFKFGRIKPKHSPRLHFHNYKLKGLPTPPITLDATYGRCGKVLSNIYCNDILGCCVVSGGYHVIGVMSSGSFIATNKQIITDYSAIGGYIPGQSDTDQGCDEITALKYWMKTGFASGDKLAGFMGVDATNPTLVMQCIDLFENVYLGVQLPDKWVTPMPSASKFTWGVAGPANPNQGHCIMAMAYNKAGIQVDSWGLRGTTFSWR
jgi:hypothetical protein